MLKYIGPHLPEVTAAGQETSSGFCPSYIGNIADCGGACQVIRRRAPIEQYFIQHFLLGSLSRYDLTDSLDG
jgi:hypothetical protein